ncbi:MULTISPECIES: hypothetical protein [unclassified Modestobacter]|uniref:hypothetical protein n=1 Tax=unclassified Modestobacter TaxID=2643866 RepID=UPI0022AA306D|nr:MULTISPECIES: hypothetical protein [unclassified Modestobacter]MCZ2811771.1 hypothetical protein [Modestobacter sp. VKM Ac-2979]MCZ2843494.1 hypothetical protein [Modestobacter sp. VKM Ac-2980]MCZ2848548.1 hypothetical protein [Modestobacter sp. VKM Ac-2978]
MNSDFVEDLIIQLTEFAAGLEQWQQVGTLLLFGMIPFVESYLGSFIGTIVGVDPLLAVPAAVIGNIVATFLTIALASGVRDAATRGRSGKAPSKGKRKVAKYFERVGVPGVSLLGAVLLPTQITAPTLIALGARRGAVYVWMAIAITVWGIAFGFFGDRVVAWYG